VEQLFWISALVPGFTLFQRMFRDGFRTGFLATLAWSFVLTLALLTPVVIVADLANLSMGQVGVTYLALVLASVGYLVRLRCLDKVKRSLRAVYWPAVLLIVVAAAACGCFGGDIQNDSLVHVAKVRYQLDVGFRLQDPYSPLPVMDSRYHLSPYHSLFAIGTWLTRTEPQNFWFRSVWFFWILSLGALESLALVLFRRSWVRTMVMLGALGSYVAAPHSNYPALVAGRVVLPLLLASIVRFLRDRDARNLALLALGAMVMGAVNLAVWLTAAMCLISGLGIWWLAGPGDERRRWPGAAAAAALLAPLPFLLISVLQPSHVVEQNGSYGNWMLRTISLRGVRLAILDPFSGNYDWMFLALPALLVLWSLRRGIRRGELVLAMILSSAYLFMFVPPVPQLLMRAVPVWVLQRAGHVGTALGVVGVFGVVAGSMRSALRTPRARLAFVLLVVTFTSVAARERVKDYAGVSVRRNEDLRHVNELQKLLQPVTTTRPMILADSLVSLIIPAVRTSTVMSIPLAHANPADGGLIQRAEVVEEFFAAETSRERRRAIVSEYAIQYAVLPRTPNRPQRAALDDEADVISETANFQLFRMRR
jgi:hypothetical protein